MTVVVFGQSRLAARSVAQTELAEVSRRVVYRVEQLLRSAEMTAESAMRAMGGRSPSPSEWEQLFTKLVPAFEQRPELTYLGYSLAKTGEAAFLRRRTDGLMELMAYVDEPGGKRVLRIYRYQSGRFYLVDETPWDGYDPRSRPFFQQAAATRKPGWTPAYAFTDYEGRRPVQGITYILPVFAPSGDLEAVWDADFDTDTLGEFLRQLHYETGAESFIVENRSSGNQWLIGHPQAERVGRGEVASSSPKEWMHLQAPFLLPNAGSKWIGQFQELTPPRPRWMVFTVSDAANAIAAFRQHQKWLIVTVGVAAMAVAAAGSVAFARWMARPVEQLRAAVRGFASGGSPEIAFRSAPRELLDLGIAFQEMVRAISDRQHELGNANTSLQKEISARTQREALLDAVISHVPFELWVFDEARTCVLQNPAAQRRVGDFVSQNLDAFPAGEGTSKQLAENFTRVLSGHVIQRDLVDQQNGRIVFSHAVFAPVRGREKITGVVCANFDVTEQRRAEEALRSSQRRLSLHLENTPLGVIDWTPDFCVAAWNPAAELIFGWSAAEALGKHASFIVPEHERAGVGDSWRTLLNSRSGTRYSNQNVTRDGRTIECEWYSTVVSDAEGKVSSVSSLVLDVTERTSAERLFRESEERFQKAFRRAPTPQAIIRMIDGCIVDVNDRWEQTFGVPRQSAVGRTSLDVGLWVQPEIRAEVLKELDQLGEVHDREVKLVRADGQPGLFLLSVTLVNIEDDSTMLVSHVDITDRQRAEREVRALNESLEVRVAERTHELENANAKLKELDRLKSEFLATMSHELRTPLNSIVGFSSILKQGMAGALNPEQVRQLEMIYGSSKHLLGLINDLLDVSRIEAGRVELFYEQVKIGDVLQEVERTLAPMVAAKHLTYSTTAPAELPPVVTDRKRLYQIVLNLANNAVKFTEKGNVSITATLIDKDKIRIAVQDTGIGIREENIGRLFEAFRQVDGSARRVYEGTGLGLFLVRKLLTLLGGSVDAASEFGRGSTFTITLPLIATTRNVPGATPSLWETHSSVS
ncbi:MAG: PAS domain S-box protein [Nibricoccus sp.]